MRGPSRSKRATQRKKKVAQTPTKPPRPGQKLRGFDGPPKAASSSRSSTRAVNVRRQQNASLLVSKLPPNVVLKIVNLDRESQIFPTKGLLGWIRLTHVFAHWRSITLADPELWSDIPISGRKFDETREWLERSQGTELRIHPIDAHDANNERMLSRLSKLSAYRLVIRQHWSRIKWLHLALPDASISQLYWDDSVAMALRTLIVEVVGLSTSEVGLLNAPAPLNMPPPTILSNLTTMQLIDVPTRIWGCGLFPPSLKELVVKYTRDILPVACTLQDVLDDLEQLRTLEVISIENSVWFVEGSMATLRLGPKTLCFPMLRSFKMIGGPIHLAALLDWITIPGSAIVKLVCSSNFDPHFNTSPRMAYLAGSISNWMARAANIIDYSSMLFPGFHTCALRLGSHDVQPGCVGDGIYLWHEPMPYVGDMSNLDADFQLEFGHEMELEVRNSFCSLLPLSDVEVLHFLGPRERDLEGQCMIDLLELLRCCFPSVRAAQHVARRTDTVAERFLLLSLIRPPLPIGQFEVKHFKFKAKLFPQAIARTEMETWSFVEHLTLTLMTRQMDELTHGMPLTLRITECYDVEQEQVEALAGIDNHVNVVWDGLSRCRAG